MSGVIGAFYSSTTLPRLPSVHDEHRASTDKRSRNEVALRSLPPMLHLPMWPDYDVDERSPSLDTRSAAEITHPDRSSRKPRRDEEKEEATRLYSCITYPSDHGSCPC